MNIDIRENIVNNFKGATEEDIKESIIDSITDGKEVTLPGLGVFFELLWNNSSEDEKQNMVALIHQAL